MNIYNTNVLVGLVPNLITSQNWLLDRFFPNVITEDKEEVSIDVDIGKRRMSPFVSPLVEGQLVESRTYQTNTFKPAYIKDKRAPDLLKPVRRQIGERIGGEFSAGEREMLNLQFEMTDQIDLINRRLEWMAANAMVFAKITVAGVGYQTKVIDFGRSSDLTVTLSGSDKWPLKVDAGKTNTKPSEDIEDWGLRILKTTGSAPTDIVFTSKSWQAFCRDTSIEKGAIVLPLLNPADRQVDIAPRVATGAVHKGRWGNYDLWLYNDWFIDPVDNVEKPMIPDGAVLMSGADLMGTRVFGAIMDPAFSYGPMAYAPKSWLQEDPAQRFLMMQSAPLVIPSRVNAALCAMVV
ncbi:major capsid protein [Xenorhabdus budapestensis]|uniref:Major capsid protein n=1 Tax=Xenorhabdus budapestensis TaxID=290110 RepID=A0ABX7VR55_XENBU|nr:major capsid protein [Xenorhabdus budapestensis]QTL41014.1 major capsid protein [Xenorhabdus budapestensis]